MTQSVLNCEAENLNQELTFEVSKEVKVVTKIIFNKEDGIPLLVQEIQKLRNEVESLKKEKKPSFVANEALIELWDNEHDDKWNEY